MAHYKTFVVKSRFGISPETKALMKHRDVTREHIKKAKNSEKYSQQKTELCNCFNSFDKNEGLTSHSLYTFAKNFS